MRKTLFALMGMLLVCSCNKNTQKENDNNDKTTPDSIVTLSSDSPILNKIKVERVELKDYTPEFSTSGVVKAIPALYAEIAMPFAGRITKSYIRLGQSVSKGTPLFELSSPSFFETSKAYFEAKQEKDQALKSLQREQDLLANRVGVKKEVEEAEVNYHLKLQDYENAVSALKVFQVNPSQIKLGEPLVMRSPIAGKVITNNIVIGQYIKEDSPSLATVADLNKVWVIAQVKEKDIHYINKLQKVEIHLTASPEETIPGTIYHVSEMLDEDTRAAEVVIECDNKSGKMKPNMYGTVILTNVPSQAIIIPTSSLLQEEDMNYVMKSVGNGKYIKTPVTVGESKDGNSVILSGITSGEEIITEGAFYLLDSK